MKFTFYVTIFFKQLKQNFISNDNKINNQLICLKTGSNAKIISYFDKEEVSYVKINMEMKFKDTKFKIL